MTVPTYNFVWQQGDDGIIKMIYKAGDPPVPVDLTGYGVRMDVKVTGNESPLYTFNTDDADGLTVDEAVVNNIGEINITVPRSVSLSGGSLEPHIGVVLNYDIFLRDTGNKQRKILKGTIVFEKSETLWV